MDSEQSDVCAFEKLHIFLSVLRCLLSTWEAFLNFIFPGKLYMQNAPCQLANGSVVLMASLVTEENKRNSGDCHNMQNKKHYHSSFNNFSITLILGCVGFGAIGVLEESENRFRASSVWHNKTIDFSAKYGRLNGNRAWCPNRNLSQWLQIDLGATYRVCGVATQGKALWTPVWVTKYKIYFSNNNVTWKIYIQNGTMVCFYFLN